MARTLREEIRQTRPFSAPEQEAHLSIERTAAMLTHAMEQTLKPFGVTPTQYNVLRILRGAGSAGLCRNDVRSRLVSQAPDVTRLLDRMEEAGLIMRARDAEDRRYVSTRITKRGLDLLDTLQEPVMDAHRRLLGHMSKADLGRLTRLLAIAREGV